MKKLEFWDNKNVIYGQLRRLRKARGLTQGDLAAKMEVKGVNIDQQMISKIENNQRLVTDYELACICNVLGVSERELLKDCYQELMG